MDVDCGDHFTIYANTKSIHCIPETSVNACQLYLN